MRFAILLLLAAGCAAAPVSGMTTIPKGTPATCESICRDMGLELESVVVMANEVGCVCRKPGGAHAQGAAAAGMAAIIVKKRADTNREDAWVAGF